MTMSEPVGVGGWWMSPDRTLVALRQTGLDGRVDCLRLGRDGRSTAASGFWTLPEPAGWEVLGWAAPGILALWRRRESGTELRLVDVLNPDAAPRDHALAGRPVACRVDAADRVAVLVATARRGRPQLWWHLPHRQTYQPIAAAAPFHSLGAWDDDGRLLALNVDAPNGSPGVVLCRDDGQGPVAVEMAWPSGVRPMRATGFGAGHLGLTGTNEAGESIPGILHVATGTVRWFAEQTRYSCTDVAPSGRRLLVTTWSDESLAYRALDVDGRVIGEFGGGSAIMSDPCFAAGEAHAVLLRQSPVEPPTLHSCEVGAGVTKPPQPPAEPAAAAGMRWSLRWTCDGEGRRMPEWVFTPGGGDHGGTVLYLHGGPGGRLSPAYDPVIVTFVSAGWTVIGMNYPGSAGYGAEYLGHSRGDWGGVDAAAIEWRLAALSAAGKGPVCLYGQSYGAYLALLAAAAHPQLVNSVAVWAAVTDIQALLDMSAGSQRRWLEQELSDLATDPQRLWQRSPVSRLPELGESHLLVGHGRLDDRCPVEQSRTLVDRLRQRAGGRGSIRYLEDPTSPHTPLTWRRWADAAVSHFGHWAGTK
jgi:pimeloyl-ACP methyl ester carboxylesterase